MPDADTPRTPAPSDWSAAFAALPMETPPADGWKRVGDALDARAHTSRAPHHRRRWPTWIAAAAVLSAVALVPMLRRDPGAPTPQDTVMVATTKPASTAASMPASPARDASRTAPDIAVASTPPAPRIEAGSATARPPTAVPRKRRNSVTTPPHAAEPRRLVADATASMPDAPNTVATAPTIDDEANRGDAVAVQSLQAESARLEALVALARDDRVASANGAALTTQLDERIGRIDASLSQPGLADGDRTLLWQERVVAMRELAGIETTQRWLTTHGERYDGALVSVD
ncbi:hypothetical protein QLQ15_00335 [Lysobacter sp. LF1]|uniref:Uncharacterized protein n=1 Tax=Lysobacter stagni TaxID=3045172 RepID=A0ABT6XB38_9GAMM|nr:hypothetical protein [Lysobacter sp. LF1]MDI9237359.1 hypothetical protein [Lysobacter sp. LF1]